MGGLAPTAFDATATDGALGLGGQGGVATSDDDAGGGGGGGLYGGGGGAGEDDRIENDGGGGGGGSGYGPTGVTFEVGVQEGDGEVEIRDCTPEPTTTTSTTTTTTTTVAPTTVPPSAAPVQPILPATGQSGNLTAAFAAVMLLSGYGFMALARRRL